MKRIICSMFLAFVPFGPTACRNDDDEDLQEICVDEVCRNIIACRSAGYDDDDLQYSSNFKDIIHCSDWCARGLRDFPEEAAEKIRCGARTSDCTELDDFCDLF